MKHPIDLRSDTVTKPSEGMMHAISNAVLGDDVFGEDPTVNKLQEEAAGMLGFESSLFCPSGTMANQIAIAMHTHPGDEVICHRLSHVYNYEGGGMARNAGVSVRLIDGNNGLFKAEDVLENINPDDAHMPRTTLVAIENTCNKGGGKCWDWTEIRRISEICQKNGLKLHLDGARLFNALAVRKEIKPEEVGSLFDSANICLSKGLGAPVGSLVLGSDEDMRMAHRIRKVMGGGMRQAGLLAAAGRYALANNISRLSDDHQRAGMLGGLLEKQAWVSEVLPVETNIVVFSVADHIKAMDVLERLKQKDILVVGFGGQWLRMVTHLDFDDDQLDHVSRTLAAI